MTAHERRAEQITRIATERELDLLLVTNPINVLYVCGFRGTNGVCLIGPGERLFVTDFRYLERAKSEVPGYELVRGRHDLLEKVAALVQERVDGRLRLGFDEAHVTVKAHGRLRDLLPEAVELVPAGGLVEELREVKDDQELTMIREASEVTDELYRWLTGGLGLVGRTEIEVARALERRAQDIGADSVAFPPIVAAGANGALPHATPRDAAIEPGSLVVVDLGCTIGGYCSDCTRTFATGELDDEARDVYELVRSAQEAARSAVAAGAEAKAVDAAARGQIEQAGRGDQFGHGIGHGVGLEVHEGPRLAPDVNGRLETGNVVTVEPGVYVPGKFGVRIEDLVVVGQSGCELLTSLPRELITV